MASLPELGQNIGRNFVAQTPNGRVAEVKVVKVHQDQRMSLEDISERKGGYSVLTNLSALLGLLEAGIIAEGITFGNHQTSIPEAAIFVVGALGTVGALAYFQERMKDCNRKIDQIKKNRLPTITS